MSDYLPFVVIGVATGAIYGLAAIGLVLTYRTSGIFNFAHGSIATVGAVLIFLFFAAHEWPLWLALLDAVFIAGPLMGLLMERLTRPLGGANPSYRVVVTLGVLLTINFLAPTVISASNAIQDLPEGAGAGRVADWLPGGSFEMADVVVGYNRVSVVVVAVLATVLLSLILRRTRIGIQMRAVVDNADLVDLTGTNPIRVRKAAWILGATFAALSGALYAPQIGLNFSVITALVVMSAGAAAFGAFKSLPLAFAGGIVLGVIEAVLIKDFAGNQDWLSGLPSAIPFIFLFGVLLVAPKKWLTDTFHPLPHHARIARAVPPALRYGPYVVGAVILLALPQVVSFATPYTRYLTYVLLFLSLGLLVKTSGQISLGHFAFAALGAAMFHHFGESAGMPWLLALVLAGLFVVPVGMLIALPAIRLSGVFLALATYAFAIALESLFYRTNVMFSPAVSGVAVPRPGFASDDAAYYYVVLAVVVACFAAILAVNRSRLGRLLQAMGESPVALETQGVTVNVARVLVFGISAFFAGIAGALFGAANFFVTGIEFSSQQGLILFVLVMAAPGRLPWYGLTAATGFAILRSDFDFGKVGFVNVNLMFLVFFGVMAIVVAMKAYKPRGRSSLAQAWRRLLDRFAPPLPLEAPAAVTIQAEEAAATLGTTSHAQGSGLEVTDLTVRYGSLVAVDNVSLAAPIGRITGLVGPNGAGKSSTFDAISGIVTPSGGSVRLHGRDVTNDGTAARARLGLGRTFQRVQLWNAMTVEQNVALGREGGMAGRSPLRQLIATRSQNQTTAAATDAALELCGITHLRRHLAGGLTTGQRRLVELARCLAGPYDVLLLDEPSSGLDSAETARFGEVLQLVTRVRGCAILLVEHDMSLVMKVCEHIYVLDVGALLFDGPPDDVRRNELVQAAYLGSAAHV